MASGYDYGNPHHSQPSIYTAPAVSSSSNSGGIAHDALSFWTEHLESSSDSAGTAYQVTIGGSGNEYLFFQKAYQLIEEKYLISGISRNFEESARRAFFNGGRPSWTSYHFTDGHSCSYFTALKEVTYLLSRINVNSEEDRRKMVDVAWYAEYVVAERRSFGRLDRNHHRTLHKWEYASKKLQHYRGWMA